MPDTRTEGAVPSAIAALCILQHVAPAALSLLVCCPQVLAKVEAILYAATAEEGRQLLISTQTELVGQPYLDPE